MPRKTIFKLIFVIAISIVTAVILMTLISHEKGGATPYRGSTKPQELILDEMRVIVTPLEISTTFPTRFRVNLESFEAPSLIDMNLEETALIEFQNDRDPVLPTHWTLELATEHTHEGILTFPPLSDPPSDFTLVIFSLSEFRFSF
jgi:hypothetical protein